MSIKQLIIPISVAVLLIGCTTTQHPSGVDSTDARPVTTNKKRSDCKYVQRNLTLGWYERSYWCIPNK